MKPVIGIDPGITGAIALIATDPSESQVFDMPVLTDGKTRRVNGVALAELMRSLVLEHSPEEVRIEKVNAMPPRGKNGEKRQAGAQSSFNFGRGLGAVETVPAVLGLRVIWVTPNRWKKRAALIGKPKDQARTKALELYPHLELHRKKDVGRADAILIAHYGEE